MGEEVERRNAELEREVTGLRNSYWTERKSRLAAEAQVKAMRKALEQIKVNVSDWDGPLLRAWDASRAEIADGDQGSGPRDRIESVFSALFWEVADDALAAPAEERNLQKMQSARAEEIACQNPQGCCCVIDGPPWVCPYDPKAAPPAEESSEQPGLRELIAIIDPDNDPFSADSIFSIARRFEEAKAKAVKIQALYARPTPAEARSEQAEGNHG